MTVPVYACAGNRFAIVDASALPGADAGLAHALCHRGFQGRALDGMLVMGTSSAGADCRMIVINADGSRPEACGDGLLCVATHARSLGIGRDDAVLVETDSGSRIVHIVREIEGGALARGTLGQARILERDLALAVGGATVRATTVDVGNPHCVLFLDDAAEIEAAPVAELGPALERHEHFAGGTNVEFAAATEGGIRARVWERGVGETEACGTGACAIAVAAADSGRAQLPVAVDYPGGRLSIDVDEHGEVWMEGAALRLGSVEVPEREQREAKWSQR